jgi:long-chain fatty acid transport protein
MRSRIACYRIPWTAIVFVLAVSSVFRLGIGTAYATNGPQFPAFSGESNGLAGAGMVAVADTSSINTNPAAMSLIQGSRFDFTPTVIKPILRERDSLGNDARGQQGFYVPGNAAFATKPSSVPRLTIGAGVFTQGGLGTDYRNLTTAFGTQDQASSFLRYFKFAVGASYEVTDQLSLGISPYIGYSDVSFRLFPNTSFAPLGPAGPTFFGLDIRNTCGKNGGLGELGGDCPSDVVFGTKVGAMYKVLPWLTVGATYSTPVRFNYTGSQATLNFTSLGLGTVNYETRIAGFKWPQQVDVSFAARPTDRLMLALTTTWINWATINAIDFTFTSPSSSLAPSQVNQSIPFNWKDQAVVAVGASYTVLHDQQIKDRMVVRMGYNWSNNPIPKETLSPLAPLIIEHRLAGGFGYRFTQNWSWDSSVLYALNNTVTYTNPNLPFGLNAQQSTSGYLLYNTVSYRY